VSERELCDRCGQHEAEVRRLHAFVCVECQEYHITSHSGFLAGPLLEQRQGEFLLAQLEQELLEGGLP
jgi:hypothetical protein